MRRNTPNLSTTRRTASPFGCARHGSPYKQAVLILFEGREATRTLYIRRPLRESRLASLIALYRREAFLGQKTPRILIK